MSNDNVVVPVLEAIVAASLAEYMLTHPSQLITFINTLADDMNTWDDDYKQHQEKAAMCRTMIVRELRKFYCTASAQSGRPMAPLNIPVWLT